MEFYENDSKIHVEKSSHTSIANNWVKKKKEDKAWGVTLDIITY